MKAYGGVEVYLHSFLTSAFLGGISGFTPRTLYPRAKISAAY